MAREEAFSFSETLPNYVVKQFTTRYITEVDAGPRNFVESAGYGHRRSRLSGRQGKLQEYSGKRPHAEGSAREERVLVERRIRQHAAGHHVALHERGLPW